MANFQFGKTSKILHLLYFILTSYEVSFAPDANALAYPSPDIAFVKSVPDKIFHYNLWPIIHFKWNTLYLHI